MWKELLDQFSKQNHTSPLLHISLQNVTVRNCEKIHLPARRVKGYPATSDVLINAALLTLRNGKHFRLFWGFCSFGLRPPPQQIAQPVVFNLSEYWFQWGMLTILIHLIEVTVKDGITLLAESLTHSLWCKVSDFCFINYVWAHWKCARKLHWASVLLTSNSKQKTSAYSFNKTFQHHWASILKLNNMTPCFFMCFLLVSLSLLFTVFCLLWFSELTSELKVKPPGRSQIGMLKETFQRSYPPS